jgi:hypothetical protein
MPQKRIASICPKPTRRLCSNTSEPATVSRRDASPRNRTAASLPATAVPWACTFVHF